MGGPSPVLRGTLMSGGGVVSPSGAQIFGSLGHLRNVCRTFTFRAEAACGTPLVARMLLDTGTNAPATPLTFVFPTGPTLFNEGFDNVTAPTFPSFFTRSATNTTGWTVLEGGAHGERNRAFAPDPLGPSTASMTTESVPIADGSYVLTFHHAFLTEAGYDGGVLEISIEGGAYQDIVAAGGVFLAGGYTGVVSGAKGSPIGGRQAWTGDSGGYVEARVSLPPAAVGHNVRLRWLFATDSTVEATGWSVDSVVLSSTTCDPVAPDVPWGQRAEVHGNEVRLQWNAPLAGGSPDYVLEASADMGLTYPYVFPVGTATSLTTTAPSGTYATRIRAVQGGVASAPSLRLPVQVGDLVEPAEVRNMLGTSHGSSAALAWSLDEPGGTVDAIEVRVGSAVGLADITTLLLPPGTTSFAADDVPAGTYHVSARQVGPTFTGHASDSVVVTIPGVCAAPDAPAFLAVAPQAGGYRFTWHLGALGTATPTSWALHAGECARALGPCRPATRLARVLHARATPRHLLRAGRRDQLLRRFGRLQRSAADRALEAAFQGVSGRFQARPWPRLTAANAFRRSTADAQT
ncbi:MAG: hypothetical protein IT177_05200 [Acidobacteria bacterium]|nr:hypothetical protein [Acidobacteriota bacterium]